MEGERKEGRGQEIKRRRVRYRKLKLKSKLLLTQYVLPKCCKAETELYKWTEFRSKFRSLEEISL